MSELLKYSPTYQSMDYDTLVLPGSSTQGLVILGSIQYLSDNYLLNNITTYIGTSSGAIICYLLSIGYSASEIMMYICTHQLFEKIFKTSIELILEKISKKEE